MRRFDRWFPLLAAALTLAVFLPVLRNDFVNWDDPRNFLLNQSYRGLGWDQLRWMWTSRFFNHYAPLTWMTLGLDFTIWGMDPAGYHFTSLLFHAANTAIFYYLALAILRAAAREATAMPWCALFASLVFGIHPLRTEPVAWASNRLEVVSGFFFLLALLVYVRRKPNWMCFVLFAMAVLSKETAIVLPAVLLILDGYPLGRLVNVDARGSPWPFPLADARGSAGSSSPDRQGGEIGRGMRPWVEKIPFVLAGLAAVLPSIAAGNRHAGATMAFEGLFTRLALAIYSFAFYLWKTVIPTHLAPFYALTAHRVDLRALPLQLSIVVTILAVTAAILFRRRVPALAAAGLAYAVTLLPLSGLFTDSEHITADRYSYLPCLGWALIAGGCLLAAWNHWRNARPVLVALASGLIVVYSWLTWRQVQTWKDSETLWTHAVAVEPSYLAYDMLVQVHLDQSNLPAAIEDLRQAIAMNPASASAHNHFGGALLGIGDWEGAIREFQIALSLSPTLGGAQNGWGYALMMQGRLDEAITHFQLALQLEPQAENVRENLRKAQTMRHP